MTLDWGRIAPVIVSIFIIIAVAIARNYSKTFAAIAATMPINVPLAMWIVFANDNDQTSRAQFSEGMLLGIFPTVAFLIVSMFVVRAGWSLVPTIIVGYVVWGIALLILLGIRRML